MLDDEKEPVEDTEEPTEDTEDTEEPNQDDDGQDNQDTEDLNDDERAELERLRKKEFNFKKMRVKTKEERAQLKEEKELLNKEVMEFREAMVKERQEDALEMLGIDEPEERKKILARYNALPGKAITKADIFKKMKEAAYGVVGETKAPSALARGGHSGYRPTGQKAESDDSKAIRRIFKIDDETKKKYSGEWTPKF